MARQSLPGKPLFQQISHSRIVKINNRKSKKETNINILLLFRCYHNLIFYFMSAQKKYFWVVLPVSDTEGQKLTTCNLMMNVGSNGLQSVYQLPLDPNRIERKTAAVKLDVWQVSLSSGFSPSAFVTPL